MKEILLSGELEMVMKLGIRIFDKSKYSLTSTNDVNKLFIASILITKLLNNNQSSARLLTLVNNNQLVSRTFILINKWINSGNIGRDLI